MEPTFIYALADDFGIVRYVGKSRNPYLRWKTGHRATTRSDHRRWMRSATVLILDVVDSAKDAYVLELRWIRALKLRGLPLQNMNPIDGMALKHRGYQFDSSSS